MGFTDTMKRWGANVVAPGSGFLVGLAQKLKKVPAGVKVAGGAAIAGAAAVSAAPAREEYAPRVGGGRTQYPFAQAGLFLIVGFLTYFLLSNYGFRQYAIWAVVFGFLAAVVRVWPKQGFFAVFGIISYVSLSSLGLLTGLNFTITVFLTVLLILFATWPEKVEKFFALIILIFGGLGIFFLSSWFQQWIGWAWPNILTTILMIAYVALVFAADSTKGKKLGWSMLILNVLFFYLLFFTTFWTFICRPDSPCGIAAEGQHAAWVSGYQKIVSGGQEAVHLAQQSFYSATTSYELGVEEQSTKPLGVFLTNVGVTSKTVQPDGMADVFATLKTTSFGKDDLKVELHCYQEGNKELGKGVIKMQGIKDNTITVNPNELATLDCEIPASNLQGQGAKTIVLEATFDFPTDSFLKSYFMPQEAIRAYKKQQQSSDANPLDQFKITDKNPVAVYSGGPLYVGIGFGQQPVPLLSETECSTGCPGPAFSITFDKNQGWLQGEFTSVNELEIDVPPGMSINSIDGYSAGISCEAEPKPPLTPEKTICAVNKDALRKLFPGKIEMPRTMRVQTTVADPATIMAKAPLAVRSVNVKAKYTYKIKSTADVTVREAK